MRKIRRLAFIIGIMMVLSDVSGCGFEANEPISEVSETITSKETVTSVSKEKEVSVSVGKEDIVSVEEMVEETEDTSDNNIEDITENDVTENDIEIVEEGTENKNKKDTTSASTSKDKKESKTSTSTSTSKSDTSTSTSKSSKSSTSTSTSTSASASAPASVTTCSHTNTEEKSAGSGQWVTYVGGCQKFVRPYKTVCKNCGATLRTYENIEAYGHNDHEEEQIIVQGDCTHDTVKKVRTVCDCGEHTTGWVEKTIPCSGHGYWTQYVMETEGDYDIRYEVCTCIVCGDVVKTEVSRSLTTEAYNRMLEEQEQANQGNQEGNESPDP